MSATTTSAANPAANATSLAGVPVSTATPVGSQVLTYQQSPTNQWAPLNATGGAAVVNSSIGTLGIVIDGGGSTITTGLKGYLQVPYAADIVSNTLLADQSGSIYIDIWKVPYASFPPSGSSTIVASAPPKLAAAQNSTDATLTGWTKNIAAGDVLAFNVTSSVLSVQRVILELKVNK